MQTDDLIAQLAENAETPTKPLKPPFVRFLMFVGISIFIVVSIFVIGQMFFGMVLRSDFNEVIKAPLFQLELFMGTVTALVAAWSAFVLSIPDGRYNKYVKPVPVILFTLLSILVLSTKTTDTESIWVECTSMSYICFVEIFIIALVPGIVLFFMVRKAATVSHNWLGFMGILSATSIGYVAQRFIEANDDLYHLLIWHIIPVFICSLLGIIVGKYTLKW